MNDAYPQLGAANGTVTIEGADSLFLATPAFLLPDDREIAWAGAKDHVVHRPDLAWAMGNFLQTDPDGDGASANTNGHIFPTEDVAEAHKLIRLTPLNMLHRKKHVFGHFVASELIYPDKAATVAAVDAAAKLPMPFPYVESLAAIWRWHFPDEYAAVKQAHDAGQAWFSMEAVAESLTCETPGCCAKTYPYKGAHHDSYCKTMQRPRSRRRLNKPYFLGGAMVIPPAVPGWKHAHLSQVAAVSELPEAERVYAEVATLAPHLEPADWEMLMAFLLAGAFDAEHLEARRSWSVDWDAALARLSEQPPLPAPLPAPASVDAGTGVIVAAVPPSALRDQLAALGTEPADLCHITLAYLGHASGDTVMLDNGDTPVSKDLVAGAVAAFAHGASPLTAEVSGWGRFPQPDDQEVTFATVDSPGLAELRTRLVAALDHAGIPIAVDHGFQPHISLAYHPVGAGTDVELPTGMRFSIDELELWWGTEHRTFALGAGAIAAAAEALADIEEMYDRAFTAEERRRLHSEGKTMPDGSYPVETLADLDNAIAAYGRCPEDKRAALKSYLHRRAAALSAGDDVISRIDSLGS